MLRQSAVKLFGLKSVVQSCSLQSRTISVQRVCLADRLYSDKHEWVTVEGETGTVGISKYAQVNSYGTVLFCDNF